MIVDAGYNPGGGMFLPSLGLFYLNIPKNASTYLTNVLKENNWIHWNIRDNPTSIKTTIAFIRDPLERWVSGFATYAALHLFGPGYGSDHFVEDFNELTKRIIFDQIIFDDHTDFQVNYVQQILNYNPVFFRYNKNIIQQINCFLGQDLNTNIVVNDNASDSNFDTRQVAQFIQKQIDSCPDLKARIVSRYKKDYDFINQIEFYNAPR